ncbi:MAG TPA: DUF1592 domain-containing protein [Oligoflexus sp.]|uniref:DUF1592 domain-containing protein n=1 Tax=Oligoflexus sp. TaxID=1971216 RepID=UPI002D2D9C90|nr:DUF1592 domain-containing protein [Oligoflexus sp.]HYX32823.1 DUF1592 domain-containing protein [Oligoflexus sp.]
MKYLGAVGLIILIAGTGCREFVNYINPEKKEISLRNKLKDHAFLRNSCSIDQNLTFNPIGRLNVRQLGNTLRAITGYTDNFTSEFPEDPIGGGFDNNLSALGMDALLLNKLALTGENVASRLARSKEQGGLMTCVPTPDQVSTCAASILHPFMEKAFRRPPASDEKARILQVVTASTSAGDTFAEGLTSAFEAILLSPHFIYRIELDPNPAVAETRNLDSYEIASRLSYMIWNGPPDTALMSDAASGNLQNEAALLQQFNRMIADPKAEQFVESFVSHWLEYHHYLDTLQPNSTIFPAWKNSVKDLFKTETKLFFQDLMNNNLPTRNLLDAPFTYVNNALASHYGLPAVDGSNFVKVNTAPSLRRGILGQGSFLLAANSDRTSPVKRGRLVQMALLCTKIPDPPPNVETDFPPPSPGSSMRETLAAHRQNPVCAGCHDLLDPPGLAFENFNAIGEYRTQDEGGNPIDASGQMPGGGAFTNAAELAPLLGPQEEFRRCFVEKLFTYSVNHVLNDAERCEVNQAADAMVGLDKDNIKGALERIILSTPFRKRKSEGTP